MAEETMFMNINLNDDDDSALNAMEETKRSSEKRNVLTHSVDAEVVLVRDRPLPWEMATMEETLADGPDANTDDDNTILDDFG